MTHYSAAWNRVRNVQGFSTTGTDTATPLTAPGLLPTSGVAQAAAETLDYYVRFTSFDGTTLTLDGNQFYALQAFAFGATQTLNIGSQSSGAGAGKVAFDALTLSFGDAALDPGLFARLASGTPFKEVDVLGYRHAGGALISETSFGLLAGAGLTIDQSGVATYTAQYGAVELQHSSQKPDGTLVADPSAAWNLVRNIQGFSTTGSNTATPLAAPATLATSGVAPASAELLKYYVRFTSFDGTTLTLDGNSFYALQAFSYGATQTLNIGSQSSGAGAGKVAFGALTLSFGDAALNSSLFTPLASGTAFKEVDVLGYSSKDGALISDTSFGLLAGASLAIDQSGVTTYSAQYGAVELQHNSQKPDGTLVADPSAAWNRVRNIQGFSTTGSDTATPLPAPARLPTSGVAQAAAETLDYYVRFTSSDGTTLTLDGNQFYALQAFDFGATQTLNIGSQSSGAGAGKVAFDALTLSFGDAALDSSLFNRLASGTPFKEVDVLGYRHASGALISDTSFGLLAGASLAIDQTGVTTYSAQYGAVDLQHNSQKPDGTLVADYSAAWNLVRNVQGFSTTGSNTATPLAAPATLPKSGVAPASAEVLKYYVRFTSFDGTTLTLDGNQFYALQTFNFGATQTLNIGGQASGAGAGKVAFDALTLSFGDAALNPSLFARLASGTAFKEVDVLGYTLHGGALISDTSFGLLAGASLAIDQSGVTTYSAQYGAVELQHNSQNPDGTLVADPSAAWNRVKNVRSFSTSGSDTATPLPAPAVLPTSGVAQAAAEALDYYVRFTSFDGTTLTLDGNQFYALQAFAFGATQTLNIGSQSSGAGAGKVAFDALTLSFGDAALNPGLFAQLASGTPFKEVDVLGYRHPGGALISDTSFGLLAGASLAIDQTGVTTYSAQYGAVDLQHTSQKPDGTSVADPSAAWNLVRNIQGFSTTGTNSATPLAAPATLPKSGVAPASAEVLDYAVRFTSIGGTTLTLDGNQFFALQAFSFGATQTLNIGSQSSGAGAGKVAFDALTLSFGAAALNPSLFARLASGTAFKEVDVLGYRHGGGALVSNTSFGLLAGASLTVDQSGVTNYSAQYGSVELQTDNAAGNPACYCHGTLILTERGAVRVEDLTIGDRVVTLHDGLQAIKWIGRRAYNGRLIAGNKDVLPICIKQNAIAESIPARDLHVSPGHAICIDGALIHASRLVNGVSVTQAASVDRVTYYHIETEHHAVLFAEGCPAETFIDEAFRAQFENAAEYRLRYPGQRAPSIPCLPVLDGGFTLDAIQQRLNARAGLVAVAQTPGALRGYVDVPGPAICSGWAQDAANPDRPVCLDILIDGRRVALVLANLYRADLRDAGMGNGCHAFRVALPSGSTGALQVRRAVDGADLRWTDDARALAA